MPFFTVKFQSTLNIVPKKKKKNQSNYNIKYAFANYTLPLSHTQDFLFYPSPAAITIL